MLILDNLKLRVIKITQDTKRRSVDNEYFPDILRFPVRGLGSGEIPVLKRCANRQIRHSVTIYVPQTHHRAAELGG